jgi:DNA-binding NarL/FixJ family response regulator
MAGVRYRAAGGAPQVRSLSKPAPARGFDERLDVLKTRALQVVLCIIEGDDVRRTAEYLHLSPTTVRRDLQEAKRVLGCADVEQLRRLYAA